MKAKTRRSEPRKSQILKETSESSVHLVFLMMNLKKSVRSLLYPGRPIMMEARFLIVGNAWKFLPSAEDTMQ
jgi:hypothetical protein